VSAAAADGTVAGAVEATPDRLTTFGCLDTVLIRATGSHRSAAYATAHRLRRAGVVEADVEVVVAARTTAAQLVRTRKGAAATPQDVAVQQVELLGLDASVAATVHETACAVDRAHLRPVPAALADIARARDEGSHVGFLSDSVIDRALLGTALEGVGAKRGDDELWLASDLAGSKRDGTAYDEVARRLGGRPQAWRHVGHDPDADGRMAAEAGLAHTLRRDTAFNRYEHMLDRAASRTAGMTAVMAGASRTTRLELGCSSPAMPRARAAVVAGVAGPLLAGYVLWTLQQARDRGVRRLYFVARDGEVMLRIARRLAPALDLDVELRYLEGSRRAWLPPSSEAPDRGWLTSLLEREEHPTVRRGLDWVGVAPEAVEHALQAADLPPGRWDEPLEAAERARLVEILAGADVAARSRLGEAERSHAAAAYLREVGLLDDEPYGIVDGAGHANIGRLLSGTVVRHGGAGPAFECYYGLQAPSHRAPGREPLGYAYDEWRDLGGHQVTDLWVALEMFTTAAVGRVEGYRHVDGRGEPFRSPANEQAASWGMGAVRDGLELYATQLARCLPEVDPWVDVRTCTAAVAAEFWERPTDEEVHAWGGFPFEASSESYPIARAFTTRQVLRSVREGSPRLRRRGSWPAGTRLSAAPHLRMLVRVTIRAHPAVVRLRRVLLSRSTTGRLGGSAGPRPVPAPAATWPTSGRRLRDDD